MYTAGTASIPPNQEGTGLDSLQHLHYLFCLQRGEPHESPAESLLKGREGRCCEKEEKHKPSCTSLLSA